MNPRLRKLIGLVALLVFLLAYVILIADIAKYVPNHGPLQFAFYALAGVCWGVPILPLISWMNRVPRD